MPKLKISQSQLITNTLSIVFAIWAIGGSLYYKINSIVQILLVALVLICYFLLGLLRIKKIKMIFLISIMMLFPYFFNNAEFANINNIKYFCIFPLALLFVGVSENCVGWSKNCFKIMNIGYLIYATATILMYFYPNLISFVCDIFPESSSTLMYQYNMGAMPGLTNHYSTNGMLLATGLLFSGGKYISERKIKSGLLSCIFIVAILLTGKRAHILFSIAALIVAYYVYESNNKIKRIINLFALLVGILVVTYIIISFIPALSVFIDRFMDSAKSGDITLGRTEYWELALDYFKNNPIIGIGWNQFELVNPYGWAAHNIYIQLLCETGILGLGIYLTWFISFLLRTWSLLLKCRKQQIYLNSNFQTLLVVSLAIQLFFLLYGITGNPLYDKEMFVPYFLACAITWNIERTLKKERNDHEYLHNYTI